MLCNTCYVVVWGWGWYWVVGNTYSSACRWECRTHWQGSLSWWRWSESDMVTLTCRVQVATCRHCRNWTDHRHEEWRDELVKTLVHQNMSLLTHNRDFWDHITDRYREWKVQITSATKQCLLWHPNRYWTRKSKVTIIISSFQPVHCLHCCF